MLKKVSFFFTGVALFSFHVAFADVIINEVQVLPTGEKFFELRNTGSSSVLMTGWSVKKKTATGTESSLLVAARLEGKSIPAGGYFLIANETGYGGSGTIDAGWPPSNTGVASNNTIIIYDGDNNEVDKFGWGEAIDCGSPCPPNPEGGQSLQRTSSNSWITATPTPKKVNATSPSAPEVSEDEEGEPAENSSKPSSSSAPKKKTETKTSPKITSKIKTEITAKTLAYAEIPLPFLGTASGTAGERLSHGKYFWNFGDGDSRESKVTNSEKFTHTYLYPGEYTVRLEYYSNSLADMPDAIDETTVTVVVPEISISSVGGEADFFVELANDTDSDIDISNWILSSDFQSFTFPKNTIINSGKKMKVSSGLTHFSLSDKSTLKLSTSQGKVVFEYGTLISPIVTKATSSQSSQVAGSKISSKSVARVSSSKVLPENLEASVISSERAEGEAEFGYGPTIVFMILLIGSAGTVLYVRRQRMEGKASTTGDDFKILDE